MRLGIVIHMDDQAFMDDRDRELKRLFKSIRDRLENTVLTAGDSQALVDSNGNSVGYFLLENE